MRHCLRWTVCSLLLMSVQSQRATGDDTDDLREYVKSQVTRYEVFVGSQLKDGTELHEEPILLWSQPILPSHRGGVFVWTKDGRPEVLTRIVIYELTSSLDHTFSSLALTRAEARENGSPVWMPVHRHTDLKPFPGAPPPAKTAIRRLNQIRAMAGEFESELMFEGDRPYKLRLMPRPLFRYKSTDVLDGALLGLAQGNDAKVILLLESRRDASGADRWHYAMAPITLHGVTVSLHGEEVIRLPFRNSPYNSQEPYYLRKLTRSNFQRPN